MKKFSFAVVFLALFVFFAFGDTGEQEEIDFLLFLPNSSNLFVNERQAMIQLDNMAKYLADRNLVPGQIIVYGYAAAAANNIEPIGFSRERALFVINELQKRGVPNNLFSEPVGYGEVDLWGRNTNEENRSPNRRVRILLDGDFLTPDTLKAADPEIKVSGMDDREKAAKQENFTGKSSFRFPWKLLLSLIGIAIIAAIVFFASKNRKSPIGKEARESAPLISPPRTDDKPRPVQDHRPSVLPLAASAAIPVAVPVVISEGVVNLEEEIRRRAYELYQQRNGQNGDAEGDWFNALSGVSARYEAKGCKVYTEAGTWWARRSNLAGGSGK